MPGEKNSQTWRQTSRAAVEVSSLPLSTPLTVKLSVDEKHLFDTSLENYVTQCKLCQSPCASASCIQYPTVGLAYDVSGVCLKHNGPEGHPESSRRLSAILQRMQASGLCHRFPLINSREASVEEICVGHHQNHWEVMKQLSCANTRRKTSTNFSVGSDASSREQEKDFTCYGHDLYYCSTTATAAATALGTTLNLVDAIMCPKSPVTTGFAIVRPPGHHANAQRAMGFCFLNNVAIAAKLLKQRHHLSRIMVIDFDVHHGNGTQDVLNRDPSFLYFSIHRHDNGTFYPRGGGVGEKGLAAGKGYTINVPLSGGYGDRDIYLVTRDVLVPATEAYKPEFILVSAGYDAAEGDPIGGCHVSLRFYGWLCRQICLLARRHAHGRAAFVLEGGYNETVLANCVEACIEELGQVSLEVFPTTNSANFHVERFFDIETLTTLHLRATSQETFASRLPRSFSFSHCGNEALPFLNLDFRYDILSQISRYIENYPCDVSNLPIAITECPTVWCGKMSRVTVIRSVPGILLQTLNTLRQVYDHHRAGPLRLPPLLPNATKVSKRVFVLILNVSFSSFSAVDDTNAMKERESDVMVLPNNSTSVTIIQNPPDNKHDESSITLKVPSCSTCFETVGGHLNQWHITPYTLPGYVTKVTTCSEAMFYWWMNCGEDAMTLRSDVAVHKTEAKISQRSIAQFKAMTPVVLPQNDVLFKQLRLCIPRCVAIGIPTKNQEGRSFHVDMENLLNQFRKPAIMDMKMGIRMYADNATPQKRLRMMQKAAESTSLKYGLRLTAWKTWDAKTGLARTLPRADAARIMQLSELQAAFDQYLDAAVPFQRRSVIATLFKEKVEQIYKWFSTQTIAHFYSSSLLFMYEASDAADPKVDIRMIDFAHVTFQPSSRDTGYLQGLSTLLSLFKAYLAKCQDPVEK